MYTWNNKWILPYESIWSIVEKFKYSNSLTSRQFGKCIGAKKDRNTIFIYTSMYACNNSIDKNLFIQVLDKDVFYKVNSELQFLLGSIYNVPDLIKYMAKEWRYCPECIKLGYHSICHQLVFFNRCIIHNIELKTKCPACTNGLPYYIEYSSARCGFKCSCGYSYTLDNCYVQNLKNWNNEKISIQINNLIAEHKLPKEDNIVYLFPSFLWFLDDGIKTNLYNLSSKNFLDIIKYRNGFRNIVLFTADLHNTVTPGFKNSVFTDYDFIILDQYLTLIKSISRHIRKKYKITIKKINKYKRLYSSFICNYKNARVLTEDLLYKNLDLETFAYIMWRANTEGHKTLNSLHTEMRNKFNIDSLTRIKLNITNTLFYRYALEELSFYFRTHTLKKYNYQVLTGVLEHILGNLLIGYYNNWMSHISNMKYSNPNVEINFEDVIPPPIIDFVADYDIQNKKVRLIIYNIRVK